METFFLFLLVGVLAQSVDGALGMAYGVISSSVLLAFGVPPAMASATVHGAEVFTTAASAGSHVWHKNVEWRLFVPLAIMGVFLVRGCAQFVSQYALTRIANEGMLILRQALFARLLAADMALFTRQSASTLSNTVVYEVQTGATLLVQALLGLSRDGFTLLALLGYLLYLNWQLTLIVTAIVPGVAWIMKTLSRRLYSLTKRSQKATDELAYVVEENVLAHRMVRLHGAQTSQAERFGVLSRSLRRLAIKATIASSAMTPLTQLLAAAALSTVICVALWQGRSGTGQQDVTVGGFVAFITAMLMLIAPIRRLADVANPITRGVAALERGMALLGDTPAEVGGSYAPAQVQGAITLQGVSVSFAADQAPALVGCTRTVGTAGAGASLRPQALRASARQAAAQGMNGREGMSGHLLRMQQ